MDALQAFCTASGLKINVDKSRAMCSRNITCTRRENFTGISSIRFATNLGKYLGFPLISGRVSKATFSELLERVQNRLASWKDRLLNRAGRVCLAKSILSSLPIHLMQFLWLPKNVCLSIDATVRSFVWSGRREGRSFNLVN